MTNWAKSTAIAVSLLFSLGTSNAFARNHHTHDTGHGNFGPFILSNFEAFCNQGTASAQYKLIHNHYVLELAASGLSSEGRVQVTPVNGVVFQSIEVLESGECGTLSSPTNFEIAIDYIPPGGGPKQGSSFQCGTLPSRTRGNIRFLEVRPGTIPGNGNPIPEGSTLVEIILGLNTSSTIPNDSVVHKAIISGVTLNGAHVGFDMTVPSAFCPGGR